MLGIDELRVKEMSSYWQSIDCKCRSTSVMQYSPRQNRGFINMRGENQYCAISIVCKHQHHQ